MSRVVVGSRVGKWGMWRVNVYTELRVLICTRYNRKGLAKFRPKNAKSCGGVVCGVDMGVVGSTVACMYWAQWKFGKHPS